MVFVKKLKGGRQIISHQKMKGSGLKAKTLKKILQATYKNKQETPSMIDDYIYFDDFSTDEVKVYGNEETNQVVVAVRGTKITNTKDILTDLNLGRLTWTGTAPTDDRTLKLMDLQRFRSAKEVLDKVIDYFHTGLDFKIDVIGHSLGGKVAYEISRNKPSDPKDTSLRPEINNVITVNSAGTFNDVKTFNPVNKFDVRSREDFLAQIEAIPPQPFTDPTTGISNTIYLELTDAQKKQRELDLALKAPSGFQGLMEAFSPTTYPPYLEHKLDILDRIEDQNRVIGSGKNKISQYVNFILGVPK